MTKKSGLKTALKPHDFNGALEGERKLKFLEFAKFNQGSVGVFVSGKGKSPWEYHSDSDEFLQVLEGEAEIQLITEDGIVTIPIAEGQCLVVPQGHWHRHVIAKFLKELWVTPGSTTYSKSENPQDMEGPRTSKNSSASTAAKKKSSAKTATKTLPEQIREYALSFPETREDLPWGYPAFKVRNKMFVAMSFKEDGINLTVKLTESRLAASAFPFVQSTGYGLGDHGWITAALKQNEARITIDVIKAWIRESFRSVAPKTVLKEFDQGDAPSTSTGPKPANKVRLRQR